MISRYLPEKANSYIVIVTNASVGAPELFDSALIESIKADRLNPHEFLSVNRTFF